jgi:hypothetical protein
MVILNFGLSTVAGYATKQDVTPFRDEGENQLKDWSRIMADAKSAKPGAGWRPGLAA